MINTDIGIEFRSAPGLLCPVRQLVRSYVSGFGFGEDRCHEVMLAVDEACTNAVRHSYGGRDDGVLVLALRSNAEWVEIELRDEGRPAAAEKVRRQPVTAPAVDSLTPGGLGVQLIYEVFDEACFAPGEHEGNCVTMRLKRPVNDCLR